MRIWLDLSSFRTAIERRAEALALAEAEPSNDVVRDGTIQRFEPPHELSREVLRRVFEATEPSVEVVSAMRFPSSFARHLNASF